MSKLYPRWQRRRLDQAMTTRRVVLLTGPRQCGKTTLAKTLISDDVDYRTLDELTLRQAAESDPHGFVKRTAKTLIIDEVQRVPDLLPAIKKAVDDDTQPGQYLLTGSVNIPSLPAVRESLAGRISKVRLRPLSQGELAAAEPHFLDRAFERVFAQPSPTIDRDQLLDIAFQGGFPEAIGLEKADRKQWHLDYIEALLERDLKDITRIHRLDAMHQLVRVLAAWSSKLMDVSAIGSGLSIRRPTLEAYINALEALFLVERVPPWTRTDYERVGRQTKLFVSDCGLVASLLGWRIGQVRLDADRSGKIFETLALNEIAAQIEAAGSAYELFHYRDREKREIDFMIERDDGALLGLEIKAGSSVQKGDFRHLRWFRDGPAEGRPFVGIILYTGEVPVSFGDRLWAVPFGALWT